MLHNYGQNSSRIYYNYKAKLFLILYQNNISFATSIKEYLFTTISKSKMSISRLEIVVWFYIELNKGRGEEDDFLGGKTVGH